MKEICWGIIGAGDVCEVKSGPALSQIAHSRIGAVMRRTASRAKDFATRHGVLKWYDDADKLLNDPEINAIYVATPPSTHAAYTLKAAAVNKPVYVEKPMARTYSECLQMIHSCEQAGVPLFVAYYRRALPSILKIKELIDQKAIGEVRSVTIDLCMPMDPDIVAESNENDNWRVDPSVAGGGYFYDLASHQLDALDFLFGPIASATGISKNQSKRYPADDATVGVFEFQNGIIGHGLWSFNTGNAARSERATIIGSRGQLSFPFFGDHHVVMEVDGAPARKFEFEITKHIQQPLLQTVVDELRGLGTCPSTGVSGARTNRVMEQITAGLHITGKSLP